MSETNTSGPDRQAKEHQAALEYCSRHPGQYPMTERERLAEEYADEAREERIRRRNNRRNEY